jgi:nuclear cap-binding protein subunit 2
MNFSHYWNIQNIYEIKSFNRYYFYLFQNSFIIYIGNLSYCTNENRIYEFFSCFSNPKRIIMGLHRISKNPCGFCFLEFFKFNDAKYAYIFISGCKLDKRILHIDLDRGFISGREYGRSKKGWQLKDDTYLKNKNQNNKCYCN